MNQRCEPQDVLRYWFGELEHEFTIPPQKSAMWWKKSDETDREIRQRFAPSLMEAKAGHLNSWLQVPKGRLALIILLDQFSRNIHRGTALAFAGDEQALELSKQGIERAEDQQLYAIEKVFMYMPLEHSEQWSMQQLSMQKFRELQASVPEEYKSQFAGYLDFAKQHAAIIERFGRFPHRNEILGRKSSEEEIAFLKTPNSSF